MLIYFTDDDLKAYIKTSIENKEIDKNFNFKTSLENEKKTFEGAIVGLKEEINQILKSQNLIDVNTPSFLDLSLNISKPNDYLSLRTIIESIDLIETYSVLEMTNKKINVRLKYKGKLDKLRDRLLENKIYIKIIDDIWNIKVI